jgi:hypothetical protein
MFHILECKGPLCQNAWCGCQCHDSSNDVGDDDPPSGRLEDTYDTPEGRDDAEVDE